MVKMRDEKCKKLRLLLPLQHFKICFHCSSKNIVKMVTSPNALSFLDNTNGFLPVCFATITDFNTKTIQKKIMKYIGKIIIKNFICFLHNLRDKSLF